MKKEILKGGEQMKTERLVSIVMLLLERERIGAKELADMFEVSKRTIYRDIDAINIAGIPVRALPGVGGGFEIMQQYKVDKKVFSASDLSAILMGLSGLSDMLQGDEMVNALAKIRSIIPEDRAKDIELKASQIYIDLSPWMVNSNIQPYLEIIKTALGESRLLSFDYIDRRGNKTARAAEPYQLVLKNSHWYFQGYCRMRSDFRLFKLSRMSELKILEERFTPREYEKPRLDFSGAAAVQSDITLRIHKSVVDRVLDFCTYDKFVPDGEEHYIVSFPFVDNDYYYDNLISLGDKCQCIAPPEVRAQIKRRIGNIAALYED